MSSQKIRKFKLFMAWQDEKEEAWLTRMARQGLHLSSLGFPGFYYFESGEPRNDVYRLDFITIRSDYRNYIQIFSDAGWEHVGKMGGWQYFRTHAPDGETPDIYTDNKSKSTKYSRLLLFLVIFLPIFMSQWTRMVFPEGPVTLFQESLKIITAVFLFLYTYVLIMIFRRILKLKKKRS